MLVFYLLNLANKKTMVQDSYSIESLARSDVLCLDKTGTLTDGTMQVEEMVKLIDEDLNVGEIIGSYLSAFEDINVTSEALMKKYVDIRDWDKPVEWCEDNYICRLKDNFLDYV